MVKVYGGLVTLVLLLVLIAVAFWTLLTQPILGQKYASDKVLVDDVRLKNHVVTLSTVFPPRSDDVADLDITASYIYEEFSKSSKNVEYQSYDVWGVEYKNIVSSFGPKSGEIIVIGAHYDSADGLPGADDNASGVAGLLELSRLLKDAKLEV